MTELERATQAYCQEHNDDCFEAIGDECPFIVKAFMAGAKWQYEQFEKERLNFEPRLKHCDEITAEQAQIESDFVVQHLKKCNRTPTFIDAIEYGRKTAFEKAVEWLKYYIHYDDFGGNMEWLVPFENDECMIQHFKTYME